MGNTLRKLVNTEKAPQQKAAAEPVAAEPGPVLAQEPAGAQKPNKEEPKPESTSPSQEPAPESKEVKAPEAAEPQAEAVGGAAAPAVTAADAEKPEVEPEVDPTSESKEEQEPFKDAEPQPVVIDTPAPGQTEPESAVEEPPVADTKPEPEPVPNLVPEVEIPAEVVCELPPPEVLNAEILNHDLLPDPVVCAPPPSEPSALNAAPDETANVKEDQDGAEEVAAATELPAPESPDEPTEAEATGTLAQTVDDAAEEVSGLLQDLALKGSNLIEDLVPADVKTPDEACIAEMSD